ncbi:DUF885 domain-containing protein [Durusdinium trenchii]|uniref:DUF885 domain-containing protein n=1 Tax=Durusdinium trenchii TaxID=1381693 RepID=A0ABP0LMP7_9DINO
MVDCKSKLLSGVAASLLFAITACGQDATPGAATTATQAAEDAEVSAPTASETLLAIADDHARAVLAQSPEWASFLGASEDVAGAGYQGRLGGYGFEANQHARALNESFLQDIRGVDRNDLDVQGAITYDVLRAAYETGAQRNQFDFGGSAVWGSGSPYVVTQLSGTHLFLPRLLQTQQPLASKADAQNYISRLSQFGRVFDEVIESVGNDAALGVVPPYFAIEGAQRSIASFTAGPPAENPLVTTFTGKIAEVDGLTDEERSTLTTEVTSLVEAVVYPAYARLGAVLENLAPQAGRDAGVWRLGAEGEAFYQHALNSYGAGGMTGEEIHQLGLSEVARITAEMDAILQAQGMADGSVAERFEAIGQRDEMRYANTDDGRAELLADLNVQVDGIMEKAPGWFGAVPSQPVEVRRIPVYEQDSAPGGYYNSPSLDGTRPGIYWINLKDTADWPKHTLKTLTYHEAVPGHHFQRSLERAAGLPLIRNMLGYSEFSEGWALYAEQVAAEMGMYEDDPLSNLGRLQSELFRAARLVVDSGLHHKRWTREEAIDYMTGVTGDTRAAVTREVERYSVWPGQACSYKLGMLKINELRNKAEAELGDAFDIRAFHDEVLLTGSMPLPVLEQKIDRWIEAAKDA